MGAKREDATAAEYMAAIDGGLSTAEEVAPVIGQPVERAERSLRCLVGIGCLNNIGPRNGAGKFERRAH